MTMTNFRLMAFALVLGSFSFAGYGRESFKASCDTPRASAGDGVDSDDPAIYVNTVNPEASIVFGTLQKGGIGAYKLNCQDAKLPGLNTSGDIVNVDVMYDFDAGGKKIDLLVATSQGQGVYIFELTPQAATVDVTLLRFFRVKTAYGLCVYNNKKTGKAAVITTREEPMEIRIHDLTYANDEVQMAESRLIQLGSSNDDNTGIESCVADNEKGVLYVAQEKYGIHTFWAEESRGKDSKKYQVFNKRNAPSIEGLSIYYGLDGKGYLMVSAEHKKDNHFLVFDRLETPSAPFRKQVEFELVAKGGDKVDDTDGIDIINVPLGDRYPSGLFVVQDHDRDQDHIGQFSFMSFQVVAEKMGLLQDTSRPIRGDVSTEKPDNPPPPIVTPPIVTPPTVTPATTDLSVEIFDPRKNVDDKEVDTYTFTVICESEDYKVTECIVGAKIEQISVVEQLSSNACKKGENWHESTAAGSSDHNAVLVMDGCRAKFKVSTKSLRWLPLSCKSKKNSTKKCAAADRIFAARLVAEMDSSSGCIEGDTWAFKPEYRNYLTVRDDCDASFEVLTRYGSVD